MMIGIISDTHDNVANVKKAATIFKDKSCDVVFHCGDIVAPATVLFFKGVNMRFVKGNCDGDITLIRKRAEEIKGLFCGDICELEKGNKNIAAYHGHDPARLGEIINSGKFDYVFTGHTHEKLDEMVGNTRVINPGAHYYGSSGTIAVLDEKDDKLEFIEVNDIGATDGR